MVMMSNNFRTILQIASAFFMIIMSGIHADCGLPNISIRPEAQKKTIDIFADVLYWHTSETVDWAFTLSHNQSSTQTSSGLGGVFLFVFGLVGLLFSLK